MENNYNPKRTRTAFASWFLVVGLVLTTCLSSMAVSVTVTNPSNTVPALAASYTSLANAVTALNGITSISGPVTLTCTASGTETTPAGGYSISFAAATTTTNSVTIDGASSTITAFTPQTAGTLVDAIFKVIGSDNVTIKNFTMLENAANTTTAAATNNMTEFGVALFYATSTNGAQNVTIQGNTITLNRTYQNTFGIYSNSTHTATAATTSASATTTAGSNSGLKIYSNIISNVNNAILVLGPTAAADFNTGIDIGGASGATANTISNFGTTGTFSGYANVSGTVYGILIRNSIGFNVSFNSITSSNGGVTSGTLRGIYNVSASATPTGTYTNAINNNTIALTYGVASGTLQGITVEATNATTTSIGNINNNNFTALTASLATSAAITAISSVAPHLTLSISGNTFTNLSTNTTGSFTFFAHNYSMPASGSQTLNNNSIVTAFNKTGAGGTVTISTTAGSSPNGSTHSFTNNNFSNITVTGATGITGVNNTDGAGTSPNRTVTGNTFSNWTGGTGSITGMTYSYIGATSNYSTNTFSNITGQSSITALSIGSTFNGGTPLNVNSNIINNLTSTGTGGSVTGITCSNTSTTININNNTVNTLSSTGASSVSGIVISGATTTNVFANKIYDLSGNNASTTVNGLLVSVGTTITLYNNLVGDLRATAANAANPLVGLNITGGTTVNAYYNTVYLNGSSSGALFGSSAVSASTTTTVDLRNNIFVNTSSVTGTGLAAAYRRSTATLTSYSANSNRNDFFGSTIFTDGTNTDATLTAYKARVASRDANSISESPTWQSTSGASANFLKYDLAVQTGLEAGAATISGFTTDYAGTTRNATTPDIGAWELNGTPLPVCSGTPAQAVITGASSLCSGTGTTLSFSTTNYTAPGITYQWASSTTSGGPYTTTLGTAASQATGNLTTTTYYVVTVSCSASGQSSTSLEFTVTVNTLPTVAVSPTSGSYCTPGGSAVALTASGATTYAWSPAGGLSATTGSSVNASPSATTTYTVTGTDANACTNTATSAITVASFPLSLTATATPATICTGGTSNLSSSYITPSVATYGFSTNGSSGTLDPMTGAATVVGLGVDDAPMAAANSSTAGSCVALPFTFNMGGTNYTFFSASPDGWLAFANSATALASQFTNAVTSSTNTPKIYPFWDDAATGTDGSVTTLTTGTAPNRIFKVQWRVTIPRNVSGASNSTFQAWIYETSNKIELRYGTMGAPTSTSISAGITGAGGTTFQSLTFATNTASTTVANDGNATTAPSSGRLYSFSPYSAVTFAWTPSGDVVNATSASTATNALVANTTFTVTATNSGCASTATTTVSIATGAPTVNVTPAGPINVCTGGTQLLTANVTGGGQPYSYLWSNGATTSTITVSTTGSYSVTVTDACSQTGASNVVSFTVNPIPTATASSNTPVCSGSTLNLTGGSNIGTAFAWTGPNSFSSSSQSPSISSVTLTAAGVYTVTASVNGCSSTATTTVVVNPGVNTATASGPASVCAGGTANLTSSAVNTQPGVGYTFNGNSGVAFIDISVSGTSVGTIGDDTEHNLTIPSFNYNGVAYTTARVGNNGVLAFGSTAGDINYSNRSLPAPLGANNTDQLTGGLMTNVAGSTLTAICANWDDMTPGTGGSIKTQTVGNVYIVQWTNEDNFGATGTGTITFQIQLDLTTGQIHLVYSDISYGVVGFDGGESATVGLNFSASSALQYSNLTSSLVDGQSITFTPNAGVLTYAWTASNNGFTSSAQNPSGATATAPSTTYTVVMSNVAGCTASASATVNVTTVVASGSATNATCNGGTNGSVTFSATGGTAPYSYTLNGNAATSPTSGLAAGSYIVVATDNNGCTGSTTLTITQPTAVSVSASGTNTTCFGGSDGSITYSASGGSAPYSYTLNGNASTSPASGLAAGSYTIVATDNNGCTGSASVTITSPAAPSVTASNNGPICSGGSATIDATAGFVSYAWSGPSSFTASTQSASATDAGVYTVIVTDGSGCTNSASTTLVVNPNLPVSVSIATSPSTSICSGTSVTFTASGTNGGTSPSYQWSLNGTPQSGETNATYTNASLANGDIVSVSYNSNETCTSGNPATASQTITVTGAIAASVTLTGSATICAGSATYTATSTGGGSTPNYEFFVNGSSVQNGASATYTYSPTNNDAIYVIMTSSFACATGSPATSNTINITVNPTPTAPTITPSSSSICDPGTITLSSSYTGAGNVWSPGGATTDNIVVSGAGTYTYTVTYTAAGCTSPASAPVTVTIYSANSVSIAATSGGNLCTGGTVTLTATPATGNVWSTSATTAAITVNTAGAYSVINTDGNGCSATASFTVVSSNPTASISASCSTLLAGNSTTLTTTATAGAGTISSYQYVLNGITNVGTNSPTFTTSTTGSYTVIVTNSFGCSFTSAPVVISASGPLSGTYTISSTPSCSNYTSFANAVADLNTKGVAGNVTFNINGGYTETVPAGGLILKQCALAVGLQSGPTQTVSFVKVGGGANPKLTANTGTTTANTFADNIVKVVGMDNVTFNGIDLSENAANTTATTQMEAGLGVYKCDNLNGANNVTYTNGTITLNKVNTAAIGVRVANTTEASATLLTYGGLAGDATGIQAFRNRVAITNNTITNTYGAVLFNAATAASGTSSTNDTLQTISGNTITNFAGAATAVTAISVTDNRSFTISNNSINGGASTTGAITGINGGSGPHGQITGNTVTLVSATNSTGAVIGITYGGSGTGNTASISNNTVQNCAFGAATTATFNGITCGLAGTSSNVTVNGNTITANSLAGTGTFTGIALSGSPLTSTLSCNNNVITSNTKSSTGSMFGISSSHSSVSLVATMNGNTISGNTMAGGAAACTFSGINFTSTSVWTVNANNINTNTITALTGTAIGTINGITNVGTGLATPTSYTNNTINTLSIGGASTGSHIIRGINVSTSTSDARTISGNTIFGLSVASASTTPALAGIITSTGGTVNVTKNKIYGLTVNGSAGTAIGISNTGGTTVGITNNIIGGISAPNITNALASNSIIGLSLTGGTTVNASYNTIFLSGTSTGGSSGISYTATPTTVVLRNNIVSNSLAQSGPAFSVAVRCATITVPPANFGSASNNNLYYTTGVGNNLTSFNGTAGFAFAAYKSQVGMSPREQASVTENVATNLANTTTGASANYLHFTAGAASLAESGAISISGITDDYDGDLRSATAPDIGADEFAGTNVQPAITAISAAPLGIQCTATARTITVSVLAGALPVTGVNLSYAFNGGSTTTIAMSGTAGTGTTTWTATIPAATPANAVVTYSATATDGTYSPTAAGTSYSDAPLTGVTVTAAAGTNPVCVGGSTTLNATLSGSGSAPTYTAPPAVSNPTTDEDFGNITITQGASTILNNTTAGGSLVGTIGTATGTGGSYSNFTAFGPYSLLMGTTYNCSLTSITQGGNFGNAMAIYIDYNRNGVFTDAGENVYNQGATISGPHTSTGTFTVPTSASVGAARMRVLVNEGTITSPTQTLTWGEYEEYTVNLLPNLSYSWSDGTSGVGTGASLSLAPTATTTYTVSATDANGCSISGTVMVNVNPLPPSPVGHNSTQCGLATPSCYVDVAGDIYKWYLASTGGTPIYSNANGLLVSYPISTTTTFYVSTFDGSCESVRTQVIATVIAPPTVTATSSVVTNTCPFTDFSLTATSSNDPNYAYTWTASPVSGSGIPTSLGGFNPTIQATAGGTYTYTVSAVDITSPTPTGCATTATTLVTVLVPPAIDSIRPTSSTVCAGTSVTLNVYSAGLSTGPQTQPTGYLSSSATSTADEDLLNVTFGTLNNTSTCATTGGPGSTLNLYSDFTTTVAAPTVNGGSSVSFSVQTGTCGGNFTNHCAIFIDWNRDGDFLDAGENPFISTAVSGPNTVTGTITVPATASAGVTRMRVIAVETSGAIASTGTYTWGETEDYIINVIGVVAQDPAKTYSWNPGGATTPTITVTPTSTTTYTVGVSAAGNTCTNYAYSTVTVNPLPTAPTAVDSTQCGPGNATCSVTGGGPAYRWYLTASGGSPLVGQTGASLTAYNINSTTTFYVSSYNGTTTCESARVPVIQTVSIPATITMSAVTTGCTGASVTLNVSNPSNYVWNTYSLNGGGANSGISTPLTGTYADPFSVTVTPTINGTYTYTMSVTDNVCNAVATTVVTLTNAPTITSVSATPNPICFGFSTTLNASTTTIDNGPQTVTATYASSSATSVADEDLLNVTFGTLNNTSTCSTTGGGASVLNLYSDFTSVTAPTVAVGQSVAFSVQTGTCGGNFTNRCAIFIDWNRDGDFLDANENPFVSTAVSGPNTVSGSITVPATALAGVTRMRVIAVETSGTISSTGTYTWGETEDYNIQVQTVVTQPNVAVTWNPGALSGNTVTVTPGTTGANTYTATATNSLSGCSSSQNVVVNVNPLPSAPTTVGSTQCGYGVPTATVTGSGGFIRWYLTSTGGTAISGQTGSQLVGYNINSTTTFYVSEDDGTCESIRVPVVATVTQPDAVSITASSSSACTNSPVTLTAVQTGTTNNYIYTWSTTGGANAGLGSTSGNPVTITPLAVGTYTYNVVANDAGAGCATLATITINANQSPSVTVTPTTASVCLGTSQPLVAAGLVGGTSMALNGTTNYMSVPNSASLNMTTNITIAAWIKPSAFSSLAGIISKYQVSGQPSYFIREATASPYSGIGAGANSGYVTPTGILNANQWYYVAAVFKNNGANDSVFIHVINPVANTWTKYTGGTTTIAAVTNELRIGSDFGSRFFAGNIDEVRIYNTALTDAAVIGGWNSPASPAANLVAYYNFNNVSGTTVTDLSGNGNTGTFMGGSTATGSDALIGGSAISYSWTGSGLSSSTIANPTATPTTTGANTYVVTATSSNGCTASASSVITVNPVPNAPTGTNSVQCGLGVPAASVSGSGGSFNWYSAATGGTLLQAATSPTYTSSISTTTTFYVSEFDGTCEGPRTAVIATVNSPDAISASGPATACGNTAITLTVTSLGTTNNYSYVWSSASSGSGLSGTLPGATITVTPTSGGTMVYTVVATDGTCATSATVSVSVIAPPTILSATASPSTVCPNSTVTLTGLTGSFANGTGNIGGAGTSSIGGSDGNPYRSGNGVNNQIHGQFLVLASELTAAGISSGNLTSLAFTTTSASSGTVSNFTISIANTAASALTTTFVTAGFTTVFTQASFTPAPTGLNTHVFQTPFFWNGTSNLLINTCQTNSVLGTATVVTSAPGFAANTYLAGSTTSCSAVTGNAVAQRPIMQFGGQVGSTGPGSYTWQWAPGTIASGNIATVNPTTSTIYIVTATDPASGCTSTATASVTVINSGATPTITAVPSTICFTGTTTLTVTNPVVGLTYTWEQSSTGLAGSWSPAAGSGSGATFTSATITSDTYYRSVSTCGTTVDSSAATLVTVASPSVATTTPATRCGTGLVTVSATGTGSFDWYATSSSSTPLATNTASFTTTVSASTTLWVIAYIGTCVDPAGRQAVSVTVNPAPTITFSASPAVLCAGSSTTLSVSSTNDPNYSYDWSVSGTSVGTGASVTLTPGATTIYTVSAIDNTAGPFATCAINGTVTVTVNPLPDVPTTSQTNPVICTSGDSSTISVTNIPPPPSANWSYTLSSTAFSPINPINPPTVLADAGVAVTPQTISSLDDGTWDNIALPFAFTYYGVAYNAISVSTNGFMTLGTTTGGAFCCSGQVLPSSTGPVSVVAIGWEDFLLSASGTIDYFTNGTVGNRKFVLRFTNVPHFGATGAPTTAQIILDEATGTVTMQVTAITMGAGDTGTMGIQDNTRTIATSVSGRNGVAGWSAANEGWLFTPVPPSPPVSYTWAPPTGLNTTTGSTVVATPTTTTTYTVTSTNTNTGCSASSTVTVTYSPLTPPTITPSATSVCSGNTVTLDGGSGYTTYSWSDGATVVGTSQVLSVNPTASTTYTLTVTIGGCSASATQTITVNAVTVANITSSATLPICAPATDTLGVSSVFVSYAWSNGATTPTIVASTSGTYTVTVSDGTCPQTLSLVVTINAAPPTPSVTPAGPVYLCNDASNSVTLIADTLGAGAGASIVWNDFNSVNSDNLFLDANDLTFPINGNPWTFNLTVTNAAGCTSTSNGVLVTVVPCTGGITLTDTVFIEGYSVGSNGYGSTGGYMDNGGSGGLLYMQAVPGATATDVDTMRVSLIDPTTLAVMSTATGILQTNGTLVTSFPTATAGYYYIKLNHRNAIETWSADSVYLGSTASYDFSSAANKAYGNNMIEVSPGVWAIFSGDIADASIGLDFQDGVIESTDYSEMENAVYSILSGYIVQDITGDGVVESTDYSVMENNVYSIIGSIHP